jgi:hypothetical protein
MGKRFGKAILVAVIALLAGPTSAGKDRPHPVREWLVRLLRANGDSLGVARPRGAPNSRDTLFWAWAKRQGERVEVVCYLGDSLDRGVTVRRTTPGIPETLVTKRTASSQGHLVWQDTLGSRGAVYALEARAGKRALVRTSASIPPHPPELVQIGVHGRAIICRSSVPVSDRCRLELYDVAGRRAATIAIPRFGPGRLDFALPSRLAAGAYFLRLRDGTRTLATSRALIQ